ncbi:(2Fe-2S)-binding protein (plasmid) [Burkholderia sp. JP2-270]|uniref:(2Fe-2S)-binding protein n=1 Tax=Burkholderia sp. JP2-270 TaxID=2217913 RepID=UPI000DA3C933|nr:(2Fe-2S)-binding protein [Burkholderia sp. JP2-270]AWV05620.1 (2Fe-2S)-binding protein [Burkholderia sp. JP2-270]
MFRKLSSPAEDGKVTVFIDGKRVSAERGEPVAAVIVREAEPVTRTTPRSGSPRGPFCMMGVCFECLAVVDGIASTQTCLTVVRDGMRIERQHGRRNVGAAATTGNDHADHGNSGARP